MARRPEHAPGDAAPVAGTCELLNAFGSPTGARVHMPLREPFPPAPRWHTWALVVDQDGRRDHREQSGTE